MALLGASNAKGLKPLVPIGVVVGLKVAVAMSRVGRLMRWDRPDNKADI